MKIQQIRLALLAAALGGAVQAQAATQTFDFTYHDTSGDSANGVLVATVNGNGTFTAISGDLVLLPVGSFLAPYAGTYQLLPAVQAGHSVTFPGLGFNLFPDNTLTPASNVPIDSLGLVFANNTDFLHMNQSTVGDGIFVGGVNGPINGPDVAGGTLTLTAVAVPEPGTTAAGFAALGMTGLALVRARKLVKPAV